MLNPSNIPPPAAVLPRHLTSTKNISRECLLSLCRRAEWLSHLTRRELSRIRPSMILGTLFYQNSTRTRLSFECAAHRIGGSSIGFADPSVTRAGDFFQETLLDTARVIGEYTDCLVIRCPERLAIERIAPHVHVPVINGGDGDNEHPTQAMLDAWMMLRSLGRLEGKVIGLVGDPGCRDLRSLLFLLAKFAPRQILFLQPPGANLPYDVQGALAAANVDSRSCEDIEELLQKCDAIDMIPFVLPDFAKGRAEPDSARVNIPDQYRLSRSKLKNVAHRKLFIFHVGPRGPEFPPDVDDAPAMKYFEQVRSGVFLRAAILESLTSTD